MSSLLAYLLLCWALLGKPHSWSHLQTILSTLKVVLIRGPGDPGGPLTGEPIKKLNSGYNDHIFGVILAEGLKSKQYELFKASQVNFLLFG